MSGAGDYTQMFAIVRDAVKKEQQGDYDGAAAVYDRAGLLANGLAQGAGDEQLPDNILGMVNDAHTWTEERNASRRQRTRRAGGGGRRRKGSKSLKEFKAEGDGEMARDRRRARVRNDGKTFSKSLQPQTAPGPGFIAESFQPWGRGPGAPVQHSGRTPGGSGPNIRMDV